MGAVTDFVSSPRGKWITLLLWIVAAGLLVSQLPQLADASENEAALFLPADAESTRAIELAAERFPAAGTPTLVVVREPGGLSQPTWAAVAELEAWLGSADAPDNIRQVLAPRPGEGQASGLVSPDGTTMYLLVDITGEPAEDAFAEAAEEPVAEAPQKMAEASAGNGSAAAS